MKLLSLALFFLTWLRSVHGFMSQSSCVDRVTMHSSSAEASGSDKATADPTELIAKRIVVEGDVQGGYFRSCVLNEAGRFRRLVGTMTPPDDTRRAEIVVEGKRRLVEGFVRWCEQGSKKIGLSQVITVAEVIDEEPTGLYDSFYVKTKN